MSEERRMGRRPVVIAAIAIVAVVAVAAVVFGPGIVGGPGAGASPTPPPPVAVPDEVTVEGRAVPSRAAELAVAVAGTVADIPVEEGDAVRAGSVLLQLDAGAAQAELDAATSGLDAATARAEQAAAAVSQAQASVDQAEAALRSAQAAEDQVPSGASAAAKRQAAAQVDVAEASLAGARAQLAGAEAAARAADADQARAEAARDAASIGLDRHTISAPFAGTVVSIPAEEGALVSPGVIVVRIADTAAWTFETTEVDEAIVGDIAEGAAATVRLDGFPDVDIPATVTQVGEYGAELQGDVRFTVVLEPDGAVPDGVRWNMTATIRISTAP
jgi:multidrug efflux pump subunit AcrA (membrane-fusion protein)